VNQEQTSVVDSYSSNTDGYSGLQLPNISDKFENIEILKIFRPLSMKNFQTKEEAFGPQ
jgi:hypothetical protein